MSKTIKLAPVKTPILDELLRRGFAFVDKTEYVGRAADGVEVSLGSVHEPAQVESYLTDHPTPDTW